MFFIDSDKTIHLTRGDVASINVTATMQDGTSYRFDVGDIVRFLVMERKNCMNVVLSKAVAVEEATETVKVQLSKEDTTIGGVISKPVDYWYEVELNPDTEPQTIVGFDENGEKIFRLYPEGSVGRAD